MNLLFCKWTVLCITYRFQVLCVVRLIVPPTSICPKSVLNNFMWLEMFFCSSANYGTAQQRECVLVSLSLVSPLKFYKNYISVSANISQI